MLPYRISFRGNWTYHPYLKLDHTYHYRRPLVFPVQYRFIIIIISIFFYFYFFTTTTTTTTIIIVAVAVAVVVSSHHHVKTFLLSYAMFPLHTETRNVTDIPFLLLFLLPE